VNEQDGQLTLRLPMAANQPPQPAASSIELKEAA
jgi:hypothetical protein